MMPLRRLWNSLRGKDTEGTRTHTPERRDTVPVELTPDRKRLARDARQAQRSVKRDRPTKRLCARIEALDPTSLLEIGVGDGGRAIQLAQALTRRGHSTPRHYLAIDCFEAGSGSISLKEFHTSLRDFPVKAHLVPMPVSAGIDRVVRTFGQVDIIVWPSDEDPNPTEAARLARLSKPQTIFFRMVDGQWTETRNDLTIETKKVA